VRAIAGGADRADAALAFAYIERIMDSQDPALEATMAISTLDAAVPLLERVGFDKFAYEDFYEELLGLLKRVGSGLQNQLSPEALLSAFQAAEGACVLCAAAGGGDAYADARAR
jgi:ubiquitin thioesterase protein OTUB1